MGVVCHDMAPMSEEGETIPSPDNTFAVLVNHSRPDRISPINRYDPRTLLALHLNDSLLTEMYESHPASLMSENNPIASPDRGRPVPSPHPRNNLRSDLGSRVQPALREEVTHA